MALTSGFTNGAVVPGWSRVAPMPIRSADQMPGSDGDLAWMPIHTGADGAEAVHAAAEAVHGAAGVTDGVVRIDCAVVDTGGGCFVVAGGCADHPSRCRRFFASAFEYDSLTHSVTPLPDMPCARHGSGGACVGGKVYIVGGEYAAAH